MDITQARDDICKRFWDDWRLKAPAVVGSVPEVRWAHVESQDRPPSAACWARVSIAHGATEETLGFPKRHTRLGIVTVQVFADFRDQGLAIGEKLAIIARKAFEDRTTSGGVWFRNVQITDAGMSRPWVQLNVSAEFEYEEDV